MTRAELENKWSLSAYNEGTVEDIGMKIIKCPKCGKQVKITECVGWKRGRKRLMVYFPCGHCSYLVYNVPVSIDINTILKDYNSILKDGCENTWYISCSGDRYLN